MNNNMPSVPAQRPMPGQFQKMQAQQKHISPLQNLTIEQKAHIYDVLVEQLAQEGSYSILACGYITSKVITSVVQLMEEGKL